MVSLLNALGEAWLAAMVRALVQGTFMAAAVAAICLVMGRVFGQGGIAPLQCWLWRALYLKVVLCLVVVASIPLPLLPAAPRIVPPRGADLAAEPVVGAPGDLPAGASTASPPGVAHEVLPPAAVVSVKGPGEHLGWRGVLFLLWVAGIGVALARLVASCRAAGRLCRDASPVDDCVFDSTGRRLAEVFHLRRIPRILSSTTIRSPLLVGLWSPAILFPAGMLAAPARHLEFALAHELAHLRRRDLAWSLLLALVEVLFFFHPALWMARNRHRLASEIACDHWTLAATGGRRGDYGQLLMDLVSRRPGRTLAAAALGVSSTAATLQRRLLAMTTIRSSRKLGLISAIAATAVLALILPWQLAAQPAAPVPSLTSVAAPTPAAAGVFGASATTVTPEASAPGLFGGATAQNGSGNDSETRMRERRAQVTAQAGAAAPTNVPARATAPEGQRPAEPGRAVPAARVVAEHESFIGLVDAPIVDIIAPAEGMLSTVSVKEGAGVKKGDPLFRLDNHDAQLALQMQQLHVEQARAAVSRVSDTNVVSREEQEKVKAEFEMQRLVLEARMRDVQLSMIVAPMDGVVAAINVSPGQFIPKGLQLTQIVDIEHPRLSARVPISMLNRLQVGQKFMFQTRDAAKVYSGELTFISPTVDSATGVVQIKGAFAGSTEGLKHGMVGSTVFDQQNP